MELSEIERELGIVLPDVYKDFMRLPNLPSIGKSCKCLLFKDHEMLIAENCGYASARRGYALVPPDFHPVYARGLFGWLRVLLKRGVKAGVDSALKCYASEWVENNRFIIGGIDGVEKYYIYLNAEVCVVFAFELNSGKAYRKYSDLQHFGNHLLTR